MSGKQAHKLISNALPGGFSVVAIKKNMARLGLRLSGPSNKGAAGSDDSDADASDGGDPNNEEDGDDFNGDKDPSPADPFGDLDDGNARPKKTVTAKQRKRSKALFDTLAKKKGSAEDEAPEPVPDGGVWDRDGIDSASDDDVPARASDGDQRNKGIQKLAKQQCKPRPEKGGAKAQKAAPVRKNKSPKQVLAMALGELVVEAQMESKGVHTTRMSAFALCRFCS